MKKIYTIVAGFLLSASLVSCELKDEILGKDEVPTETGLVELGVLVDNKTNVSVTRAAADDAGEGQDSSVDPYNFPVSFVHQDADYTLEFDTYDEMKETESVELPIGTYTVTAHTPGELQKQMDHAYYLGEIDDLTVTTEKTVQATVECTMQNSRILLSYEEEFLEAFSDWTITLDDASDKVLTYTKEDGLNLKATYWAIAENCSAIKVNITATTADGETVHESRTITKPEGAASNFWVGGDALNISMKPSDKPLTPDPDDPENPGEPEKPSGVSGIEITVDAFFESTDNETVEVPIEGEESGDDDTPTEPVDPGEGEDDGSDDEPDTQQKVTITIDKKKCTLPDDANTTVNAVISAPGGLESVYIEIEGGNDMFDLIAEAQLGGGKFELVDCPNQTVKDALVDMNVEIPTKGLTSYTFPISAFFSLLDANSMGATTKTEGHVFHVKVKDTVYGETESQVSIIVRESK